MMSVCLLFHFRGACNREEERLVAMMTTIGRVYRISIGSAQKLVALLQESNDFFWRLIRYATRVKSSIHAKMLVNKCQKCFVCKTSTFHQVQEVMRMVIHRGERK